MLRSTRTLSRFHGSSLCLAIALPLLAVGVAPAQAPANKANYKLAKKFSSTFLRQFVYDTSVRPAWIGKSERFWYRFRTSDGTRYWLVNPVARTKVELFDHDDLAAKISEAAEMPVDADALDLGSVKFDEEASIA